MQDSVGGDNNRTPVIFQSHDNCNIVEIGSDPMTKPHGFINNMAKYR